MEKILGRFITLTLFCCAFYSSVTLAQSNKMVLQTNVHETYLVPESSDALSWVRVSPENLSMPRKLERKGAKGCGIFSFNINSDGYAKEIKTEALVSSFGLRRLAKEYIESWRWEPKPSGGIEETVLLRLDFCIAGATQEEVKAVCEYQATLPCSRKRG